MRVFCVVWKPFDRPIYLSWYLERLHTLKKLWDKQYKAAYMVAD